MIKYVTQSIVCWLLS